MGNANLTDGQAMVLAFDMWQEITAIENCTNTGF